MSEKNFLKHAGLPVAPFEVIKVAAEQLSFTGAVQGVPVHEPFVFVDV